MKNIESLPLMLPEQVESSKEKKVTSETLLRYLIPHTTWDVREQDFASELHLGAFRSSFQELYGYQKPGYIFSEEQRSNLQKLDIESTSPDSPTRKLASLESLVERGRTFYYDHAQNAAVASDIVEGEYSGMNHDLFQVMEEGYYPFLFAHTHPNNSLFSPQDYTSFLSEGYQDGTPILKGHIVLCPEIQVLALATERTPRLSDDELNDYYEHWKTRLETEDKGRLAILEKRTELPHRAVEHFYNKGTNKIVNTLEVLSQKEASGEITRDDIEASMIQSFEKLHEDANRYTDRAIEIQKKVIKRIFFLQGRATNRVLVELARSLNVKLYFATDMQHFTEFTA